MKIIYSLHLILNFIEVFMLGIWSAFVINGKWSILPEGWKGWLQNKRGFWRKSFYSKIY